MERYRVKSLKYTEQCPSAAMVCAYDPSTQETEAEGSSAEFKAILGYIVRTGVTKSQKGVQKLFRNFKQFDVHVMSSTFQITNSPVEISFLKVLFFFIFKFSNIILNYILVFVYL